MHKKNIVPDAIHQILSNMVSSTLKFLLNSVGKKEKHRFTNVLSANTNGIILILSACFLEM